jgi:Protein of unknown function (DUF4197)
MKNFKISILLFSLLFSFSSCAELEKLAKDVNLEPSLADIGNGLKQALTQGITKGVKVLTAKDGYYKSAYKILLPEEAQKVTQKLKIIPGFDKLEENLLEKINRGAEDAAQEATPIFVDAIKAMTFQDAKNILMGDNNAATSYLNKATYQSLYGKFNPKIMTSLDKFEARSLWKKAAETYNKIPLIGTKVPTDLDDYITKQALNGLFKKVEEEEKDIRTNKLNRPTDLLKKVFAKQDANRK